MFLNKIIRNVKYFNSNCLRFYGSLYEPDYLEALKPKIPIFDTINIQIKGYDYRILESYQKFINLIVDNMELMVEESWATPCQQLQIQKFKENSNIVETEYKLNIYERNIQIVDVPSTTYATLLRVLEASLPEGVKLRTQEHIDAYDEIRYVPDQELKQLKVQLDELTNKKK